MCESDDAVIETEEESLFPVAAPGEIAVESDGATLILNNAMGVPVSNCRLSMSAGTVNPDGSRVDFAMHITNIDTISYSLGDYSIYADFCDNVRIFFGFHSGIEGDEYLQYSSYSEYGGMGELVISDFHIEFLDDEDDFVSGTFDVVVGFVESTGTTTGETLSLRGTINAVPINPPCPDLCN